MHGRALFRLLLYIEGRLSDDHQGRHHLLGNGVRRRAVPVQHLLVSRRVLRPRDPEGARAVRRHRRGDLRARLLVLHAVERRVDGRKGRRQHAHATDAGRRRDAGPAAVPAGGDGSESGTTASDALAELQRPRQTRGRRRVLRSARRGRRGRHAAEHEPALRRSRRIGPGRRQGIARTLRPRPPAHRPGACGVIGRASASARRSAGVSSACSPSSPR